MTGDIKFLTFRSIENATPCCSFNLVFSLISELPCLFSSHVPLPPFLEDTLKLVELHHAFFKHDWPHDIKLGDSNRLTTYPLSCLFSRVMKYPEWDVESSSSAKTLLWMVPWKRKNNRRCFASITDKSQRNGGYGSNYDSICLICGNAMLRLVISIWIIFG